MWRAGVHDATAQAAIQSVRLSLIMLATTIIGLASIPPNAHAACIITTTGTVDCTTNTTTTDSSNIDGADSISSARRQRFNNGSAITGAIQFGVTVNGYGIQLDEAGPRSSAPITVNNEGQVAATKNFNSLQLNGNGASVSYFGDGSITNTNSAAALFADNAGGNVSIATGAGAISGATGISAKATRTATVTITTGSGSVSGSAASGILPTTANGPLIVTIGSGGVSSQGNNPAVNLTSQNGNISITANGNVSADSLQANTSGDNNSHGIEATSNGRGDIVVDGSGTVFGQLGRGIFALENATGLGGIFITGLGGNDFEGSAASGCCSAIRAEIDNPADSSNVIVDRSGDTIATSTLMPPQRAVSAGVHALTAGTGNIIVAGGSGAMISNTGLFGIDAEAFGRSSAGSISVSTGTLSTLKANGTGIFSDNSAFAIPASALSTIAVTNNGTVNSGPIQNPVGSNGLLNEGSGAPPPLQRAFWRAITADRCLGEPEASILHAAILAAQH